ncbi:MAG: regulatory protein RecX [Clostridia bacterium]|nr:regulatory protein RecX [Clostridia bacterium]
MSIISGVFQIRGVYHISCDGREEFKLDKHSFKKLGLNVGDDIDPDDIIARAEKEQYKYAYESALYILDRAARTSADIKRALMDRGYFEQVCDECIIRLMKAGLIDDAAYAQRMAQIATQKPISRAALKMKMRSKGLSNDDAEKALESISDEDQKAALNALADKLSKRYDGLEPREARRKLSAALARRGFNWDEINARMDAMYSADDEFF